MSDECFNCAGPASEQYTLILPGGKVLENKSVCDPCISDFRDTEWMKVVEGEIMMRGSNEENETN